MKNIILLGSTGSIGTQTLEVIDHLGAKYNVLALTAASSIDLLEKQARKYQPRFTVIKDKKLAVSLADRLSGIKTEVLSGAQALEEVAALNDADLVLNALVGAAGLPPSLAALNSGNKLALANKESMVIGGFIINKILEKSQQEILPVDSEHNAIFRILEGHNNNNINKLILTASGGPFRNYAADDLQQVTVEQALNHPNWNMGAKISIDSATLMNKGLEVIEAHWLFKQPYSRIDVVIHPQSIIHSMLEFVDGSLVAEMGVSNMKLPIQYVLTYPEIQKSSCQNLDLLKTGSLDFDEPDLQKFPCLQLAYNAGREGGSMPVVLNAANEVAVNKFLQKEIRFKHIPEIIEKVLNRHNKVRTPSLNNIFEIDDWARTMVEEVSSCLLQ